MTTAPAARRSAPSVITWRWVAAVLAATAVVAAVAVTAAAITAQVRLRSR